MRDGKGWPATILRSIEDVVALKQTEGGPIAVHGSGGQHIFGVVEVRTALYESQEVRVGDLTQRTEDLLPVRSGRT